MGKKLNQPIILRKKREENNTEEKDKRTPVKKQKHKSCHSTVYEINSTIISIFFREILERTQIA